MFIYTVKNLVFVLTGGEEDKLVLHPAEVALLIIIVLCHCCFSYYSNIVVRESPELPIFRSWVIMATSKAR